MTAQNLRTSKEKKLFLISAVISAAAWITLVVTVIGIAYGLFFGLFLFMTHALMIAYIKGHSVRLSESQFPGVYAKVVAAGERLGLNRTPEVYLTQAGGSLNAFATKFTGRNFVVIYSDLLEACGEDGKEIEMIIGHEIGHLALGHLKWLWFLVPARIVPLLGAAYSRACEYSCDLCGFQIAGDLGSAVRGLTILAAGGKYGKQLNVRSFVEQTKETGGFWSSVYELNASHPYLSKRVAALINSQRPGSVPATPRTILAYPLAPFFGLASPGGSAPLIVIAMTGMLAAVAIPQFTAYKNKADDAALKATLTRVYENAQSYRQANGSWPCSAADFRNPAITGVLRQKEWQLQASCKDNSASIIFNRDGEERYHLVRFDSGSIEEGAVR